MTPSSAREERGRRARRGVRVAVASVLVIATATATEAARWNWSGAITVDHQRVLDPPAGAPLGKSGTVAEASLKATVDLSEQVTATMRACTACHGLTVHQAFAEIRVAAPLNLQAGRIDVPFGEYHQRADPAIDRALTKPLPFAMGHMLRYQSDRFNLGVLPMPYVDTGVELFGDVWIRDTVQIWYAAYGVNGFQSNAARDFAFKNQLGDGGFSDNNEDMSWGGRMALAQGAVSAGASYLRGRYDPDANQDYSVWGVDGSVWLRGVQLRGEYAARETDVLDGDVPSLLRKKGFYGQLEVPAGRYTFVGRFDGLLRQGAPLATENDQSSGVLRWTGAVALAPTAQYSVRLQYEHWRFTDFADSDVLHVGVVAAY